MGGKGGILPSFSGKDSWVADEDDHRRGKESRAKAGIVRKSIQVHPPARPMTPKRPFQFFAKNRHWPTN
jgi:hypothetical protein